MKNIEIKTPMLICESIVKKDIKGAQADYIEYIFSNFDEAISLDSLIEKNKYKLDEILSDENKRNQIPWNSLICLYAYVGWSSEKKILAAGIKKKTFNSLTEYETFVLNIKKENLYTYVFSKIFAIKKFEGWEHSINNLYFQKKFDILIHWLSDQIYMIGQKKED